MMKENLGLGKLIDSPQQRDAIHIAIAPVEAATRLFPGQSIGFLEEGETERVAPSSSPVGIVDPFLDKAVYPGERFWMFLLPGTITSLRHDWSHPAFASSRKPSQAEAEAWLRSFAERAGLSYDEVLEAGRKYVSTGIVFTQKDREDARDAFYEPGSADAFWKSFEVVTQIAVSAEDREGAPFSCSC